MLDPDRFFFWAETTGELRIALYPREDSTGAVISEIVESEVTRFDASSKWLVFEKGGICHCIARQDGAVLPNWSERMQSGEIYVDDEVVYLFDRNTGVVVLFDAETGVEKGTRESILHVFKSEKVALLSAEAEVIVGERRFPVIGRVVAVAVSVEWLCVWSGVEAVPRVERIGEIAAMVPSGECSRGLTHVGSKARELVDAAAVEYKLRAVKVARDVEAFGRAAGPALEGISAEVDKLSRTGNEMLEALQREDWARGRTRRSL
jgi:hypothetical protein